MSDFEIVTTEKRFEEIKNDKRFDNQSLISFLNTLYQEDNHKDINLLLLNVGGLLKVIAIYFKLKEDEVQKILEIDDTVEQNRKFITIIKEINEKINLRYEFPTNLKIVQKIYLYEKQMYLLVNKMLFVNKIFNKKDLMENTEYY